MPFSQVKLSIDYQVKNLCAQAYPGHPKGCPNFGKRWTCPPKAPKVEHVFDFSKPIFVIWNTYDLKAHLEKMEQLHPEWSDKQKNCCLYWQGSARKALRREITDFCSKYPDLFVTTCPEAMGVNVTGTMCTIGHFLQWPPKTMTYQVAVAGTYRPFHKEDSVS